MCFTKIEDTSKIQPKVDSKIPKRKLIGSIFCLIALLLFVQVGLVGISSQKISQHVRVQKRSQDLFIDSRSKFLLLHMKNDRWFSYSRDARFVCGENHALLSLEYQRCFFLTYQPSVRHLEYLAKIWPSSCQIFQGLVKVFHDLASSGKIFEEIQDRIQDLVKISKLKSKILPRNSRGQDKTQDLSKIFKNPRFSEDLGKIFKMSNAGITPRSLTWINKFPSASTKAVQF